MGHVRRAISCIKKRTGNHEATIREYRIGSGGLAVDEPLTQFQGVLQGVPSVLEFSRPVLQG
jgi:circadian clock protein KaiC